MRLRECRAAGVEDTNESATAEREEINTREDRKRGCEMRRAMYSVRATEDKDNNKHHAGMQTCSFERPGEESPSSESSCETSQRMASARRTKSGAKMR